MNLRLWLLFAVSALLFAACREQEPPANQARLVHQNHQHRRKRKRAVIDDTNKTAVKPVIAQHDSLCITAVGDIMLGTSYPDNRTLPPDSAKDSFKKIMHEFSGADVIFGNLEGTLLDTGTPAHFKLHQLSKAYLFRMPDSYGKVLKEAGFNVLSLANNHIGDFGEPGRVNTMRVLDSLGINYGGQVSHPTAVFSVNGITYGFCAFAPNSYTLSLLDLHRASRLIRKLKERCDIVIVSFHGGGEGVAYEHTPLAMEQFISEKRGDVRAFTHAAVDAGADVILGNGPHVCRGMEIYKNRLIAYSLGNFCTYKCVSVDGACGLAPVLKVYTNKQGEFLSGRIYANRQTHWSGLSPDTTGGAIKKIRNLTFADFPQSGLAIADDGLVTKSGLQ